MPNKDLSKPQLSPQVRCPPTSMGSRQGFKYHHPLDIWRHCFFYFSAQSFLHSDPARLLALLPLFSKMLNASPKWSSQLFHISSWNSCLEVTLYLIRKTFKLALVWRSGFNLWLSLNLTLKIVCQVKLTGFCSHAVNI